MFAAANGMVVVELGLTAASNCAFNAKSDGLGIP